MTLGRIPISPLHIIDKLDVNTSPDYSEENYSVTAGAVLESLSFSSNISELYQTESMLPCYAQSGFQERSITEFILLHDLDLENGNFEQNYD